MKKQCIWLILISVTIFFLAACNKTKDIKLNVMSFNIRYDNPADSMNNWQYRKDIAAQIIKNQNIDIVGTQEVLYNQLNDLKERLPEYEAIGVGREDGKEKGEYSAIFYNKKRFEEVNSGYFWLSETPEVAGSKGWDGACERIATWAKLEDKATKKQLLIINTHLDHVGVQARQEGVSLLIKRAYDLAGELPIVITGDFNAEPESDVIKHILANDNPIQLLDSRSIAEVLSKNDDGDYTFHGFGKVPDNQREFIDYIFVSKGIKVNEYSILAEKLNEIYLSDHRPLVAKITI